MAPIDENVLLDRTQQQMRTWLPRLKRKYPPAAIDSDEDLIQEAMLGLCLRFGSSVDIGKHPPYAFGVLRNVVRHSFRNMIRRKTIFVSSAEPIWKGRTKESHALSDTAILADELLIQLNHAVHTLTPAHRRIFELLLQETDRREIKRQLGISSCALDTRICRGRKVILRLLREQGLVESRNGKTL